MNKEAKLQRCFDYRRLAHKCFMWEEDDFVDLLLDKYEERKKYYEFLESQGSIIAESYRPRGDLFIVRNSERDHESM